MVFEFEDPDVEKGASALVDGRASPAVVRALVAGDRALMRRRLAYTQFLESGDERRAEAPDEHCRVIACLDVRPAGRVLSPDVVRRLAVRRIEGRVRPDDWICMLGGSRVAVCFGAGARAASADAMGRHLARAVGDHVVVGPTRASLEVAVGVGVAAAEDMPDRLAGAAMALASSIHRRSPGDDSPPPPVVAVSRVHRRQHLITGGASRHDLPARRLAIARRALERVEGWGAVVASLEPVRPAGGRTSRPLPSAALRVLVVDPLPAVHEATRLATRTVASATRRVGATPTVCGACDLPGVLAELAQLHPHLVVLVLHPDDDGAASENGDPWTEVARVATGLVASGVPVIAVSVGASPLSVVACVEQGATGLFDMESLPAALLSATQSTNVWDAGAQARLPEPYDGLARLTQSERRVLHQMMRGRSASEIAAGQVVSISTVRTHIRSILRKLHVSSQLAAVAIANGHTPLEWER